MIGTRQIYLFYAYSIENDKDSHLVSRWIASIFEENSAAINISQAPHFICINHDRMAVLTE